MISILIRNRLRYLLASAVGKNKDGTVKKVGRGRLVGISLLYAFIAAMFLSVSLTLAIVLGQVLLPLNAEWLYFGIFTVALFSLIFVFSIFETKSEIYECRDNDLLLSMPIKPGDIIASRVSVVLIYNYIEALIIMVPCIVVYAVISGGVIGVLGLILVTLLLPLLATALASAAGYAVARITKRMKSKTFFTVAVSLVFIMAYFIGYNLLVNNFESYIGEVESSGQVPINGFLYHIGAIAMLRPLNAVLFILTSVAVSAAAYYVISKNYIGIATAERNSAVRYRVAALKPSSLRRALIDKELRRFFSSANYILNCSLGLVFELIVGVIAAINKPLVSEFSQEIFGGFSYALPTVSVIPTAIAIIIMLSSFNMMSSCALSLEGRSLWILKTVPVSAKDVLVSKTVPHLIVSAPPTVICSVLFMIATSAPVEYWIFFILTPLLANLFSALLGTVINAAFPKLEFENEIQPIKQSFSVFLVLMIQMIGYSAVLFADLILVFILHPIVVALLTLVFFGVLSSIMYLILVKRSTIRYDRIRV